MLRLFWSNTLTLHYVAEEADGNRWLIPITPMSPASWAQRKPYRGNYTLQRCPEYVERFYQRSY